MRTLGAMALALLVVPLAGACGNLTSGGASGEAEAYMTGDAAPPTGAQRSAPTGAAPMQGAPASATAVVDATVTTDVRIYLEAEGGGEVELTSGAKTVVLPAQGTAETRIATRVVDAGGYARARVVFSRVEADVRSGLVIGGSAVTGTVRVSASVSDPITIERTVALNVEADGTASMLIDLHSPIWLLTASSAGVVTREAFAAAVLISPRP